MVRYLTLFVFLVILSVSSLPLHAQGGLGGHSLNLNDAAGHTVTVQLPGVMLGNYTWNLPITLNGIPLDLPTGSTPNSTLFWNGSQWLENTNLLVTSAGSVSAASLTLSKPLTIEQGGTGAATSSGAMTNLLPSQAGNANDVLTTDGAGTLSWIKRGSMLIAGNSGGDLVNNAYIGPIGNSVSMIPYPIVVTRAGTLKNLYVTLSAAPGGSENRNFQVMVNGVITALTVNCSGGTTSINNTSSSVQVIPGDLITLFHSASASSASASAAWGLELEY